MDVVHSAVRWHLANRRQGTALARTVSQIRGSRRKIYRQKGTGNARHGTARVNIFRGGAKAHGPVPRDHSHKLPLKVRRMALRVILSDKFSSDNLVVLEDGQFSSVSAAVPSLCQACSISFCSDRQTDSCLLLSSDKLTHRHFSGLPAPHSTRPRT